MTRNNYGWVCPRCEKVWAPWVMSCECSQQGMNKPAPKVMPNTSNPEPAHTVDIGLPPGVEVTIEDA